MVLGEKMKKLIYAMCLFILLCLLNSPLALTAARETLELWAKNVLPALLPFFIASQILYEAGGARLLAPALKPLMRLCALPEAGGFAFLMSLLCGYPTGSRMCNLLYEQKQISGEECARLSLLCHTAGPVFVSGTLCTALLGKPELSLPIICLHICASVLTGIFLCGRGEKSSVSYNNPLREEQPLPRTGFLVGKAVSSGVQTILLIGGYMVFFGIVIRFLLYYASPLLALLPQGMRGEVTALAAGSLEMTQGLALLAAGDSPLRLPLMCALLSFSGLCIVMQSLALLPPQHIKAGRFLAARLVCAAIAFGLCLLYEKTALAAPLLLTAICCVGKWYRKAVKSKSRPLKADQL